MSAESTEAHLRYDQDCAILVDEVEDLSAIFYAADGEVLVGESPISDGLATIRWRAPAAGSVVDAWIVVRDSRGGVDWRELRVVVD